MSSADAVEIPLIKATNETLKGYGYLIDSYENSDIEIVTWPKQGWREIDEGTGNEGGSTEGSFDAWWEGSTLYGQNNAVQHNSDYEVDGKYILGHALPQVVSLLRSIVFQNTFIYGMLIIILMGGNFSIPQ